MQSRQTAQPASEPQLETEAELFDNDHVNNAMDAWFNTPRLHVDKTPKIVSLHPI